MPIAFGIRLRRFYDLDGLILRDPPDIFQPETPLGLHPTEASPGSHQLPWSDHSRRGPDPFPPGPRFQVTRGSILSWDFLRFQGVASKGDLLEPVDPQCQRTFVREEPRKPRKPSQHAASGGSLRTAKDRPGQRISGCFSI